MFIKNLKVQQVKEEKSEVLWFFSKNVIQDTL